MVLHWHCRKPLFGTFIVYMEIKLTSKATSLFRGFSHHWQAWKVYVTKKNNLFIFGIFEVQNNIMLHWLSCVDKNTWTFCTWKKVWFWNDTRVRKLWQKFHLGVNYPWLNIVKMQASPILSLSVVEFGLTFCPVMIIVFHMTFVFTDPMNLHLHAGQCPLNVHS